MKLFHVSYIINISFLTSLLISFHWSRKAYQLESEANKLTMFHISITKGKFWFLLILAASDFSCGALRYVCITYSFCNAIYYCKTCKWIVKKVYLLCRRKIKLMISGILLAKISVCISEYFYLSTSCKLVKTL